MHRTKIFDTSLRHTTLDQNLLQVDTIFETNLHSTPSKQPLGKLTQSIHLESNPQLKKSAGPGLQQSQQLKQSQYKICQQSIYHQQGSPLKQELQQEQQQQEQMSEEVALQQLQKVYEDFKAISEKIQGEDPFGLSNMHIPLKLTAFWKYPLDENLKKQLERNQQQQQLYDQQEQQQQQQIQEIKPAVIQISQANNEDCVNFNEYENLKNQLTSKRMQFTDEQFPARNESISTNPQEHMAYQSGERKVIWLRAREIFNSDFQIFNQSPDMHLSPEERKKKKWQQREDAQNWRFTQISPLDILQGELGDCYFLAALSSLAEFPERIQKIFITTEINQQGIYAMKFLISGKMTAIYVDDQFPCNQQTKKPVFSSAHGNELWVLLLEKAYAKIYGSYKIIEGGLPSEVLHTFTGAPTESFMSQQLSEEEGWHKVKEADEKNYILAAGTKQMSEAEQQQYGLVPTHAYTLISCFEVQGHKLILLRNPWGQVEWKGNWSDNSPLWTEQLKRECGQKAVNDGLFFMEYKDFIRFFQLFEICYYNEHYIYSSICGKQQILNKACCYSMSIQTQGRYYISLHQKDRRFYTEQDNYNYSPVKFIIVQKQGNQFNLYGGEFEAEKSKWTLHDLQPGEYLIYVRPYWTDRQFQSHEFVVSSYGPSKTKFQLIPKPADFIHEVFLQHIQMNKNAQNLSAPNQKEIIYNLDVENYEPKQLQIINESNPQELIDESDSELVAFQNKLQSQLNTNKPFCDPQFPAQLSSISSDPQRKFAYQKGDMSAVWMRPSQIFNNKQFSVFDAPPGIELTVQQRKEMMLKNRENQNKNADWKKNAISPEDIKQGSLGDCYFLAGIASCAEFPERIMKIFANTEVNTVGMYGLRLIVEGEMKIITVDDQFPCQPNRMPLFSSSNGYEIWVLLLEKAWAKIYGSYENVEAGFTREAMFALTGAPTKYFPIEQSQDDELWEILVNADKQNFILATGTSPLSEEQQNELGLVEGHAYTIISCFNAEGNRLLLLRNPWGQKEWKGKWSDNSSLWTPSLRKICGHTKNADDGLFFMEYNDFKQYYDSFEICYYHDNYQYSFKKSKQQSLKNAVCFEMNVQTAGEYYISVHQQNDRFFNEEDNYNYSPVKLLLAKKINNNKYEYIDGSISPNFEFWVKASLQPGIYIIYARPYWINQNIQQTFTVSSYGPSQTSIQQTPRPQNFLKSAFLNFKKTPKQSTINKDLQYQFYQDYTKGFGYLWLKNLSSRNSLKVSTEFSDSTGYKFKKPAQGYALSMNVEPQREEIAILSIYDTATVTLSLKRQSIQQI